MTKDTDHKDSQQKTGHKDSQQKTGHKDSQQKTQATKTVDRRRRHKD